MPRSWRRRRYAPAPDQSTLRRRVISSCSIRSRPASSIPPVPGPARDRGDATTIALGQGAQINNSSGSNVAEGTGVSTILTSDVNPANAGNITLTIGGDIFGIENVLDTLAIGVPGASPPSGLTSNRGAFIGQFWLPWLLTNPPTATCHGTVNFGSFDQGIMSIGGNVTVKAGGDIHDLAVSLPPPLISILRMRFISRVVATFQSLRAAASIAAIFTSARAPETSARAARLHRTSRSRAQSRRIRCRRCSRSSTVRSTSRHASRQISVASTTRPICGHRGYLEIPWHRRWGLMRRAIMLPGSISCLMSTSMSSDSRVSIQADGRRYSFQSLTAQAALFNLGQPTGVPQINQLDTDAAVSSLLLPASL